MEGWFSVIGGVGVENVDGVVRGSSPNSRPAWADTLEQRLEPLQTSWPPTPPGTRPSAVMALLSLAEDPVLVLTLRARGLEHHGGQISLPGGGYEPCDAAPVDTALRETDEEVGLAPSRVTPLGQLSTRQIPVSHNQVIPLVGLWSGQEEVSVHDTVEVDTVIRWTMGQLADPAHRMMAVHPRGGSGPAWQIGDMFLWGFTGAVVDALLRAGGWDQPWDTSHQVEVPSRFGGPTR